MIVFVPQSTISAASIIVGVDYEERAFQILEEGTYALFALHYVGPYLSHLKSGAGCVIYHDGRFTRRLSRAYNAATDLIAATSPNDVMTGNGYTVVDEGEEHEFMRDGVLVNIERDRVVQKSDGAAPKNFLYGRLNPYMGGGVFYQDQFSDSS